MAPVSIGINPLTRPPFAFMVAAMDGRSRATSTGISFGYALGMTLAVVLSWSHNASILWGILHGGLSWFYVVYFAVTRP